MNEVERLAVYLDDLFDADGEPKAAAAELRRLSAINAELVKTLELCYDHCRLYYPEVEHNNVGGSVRQALEKAKQ